MAHGNVCRWFVHQALGGPDTLWLNLSLYNTGLCIVLYREGLPARVVAVNDSGHLPDHLARRGGIPDAMRW